VGGVGFVPQLGLLVCCGGHLTYLGVEASGPTLSPTTTWGTGTEATNCFLIYFVAFLFLSIFSCAVPLLWFSDLFLSFVLLFVDFVIQTLVCRVQCDGEIFYSSAILQFTTT
jgi:hypothetical protein